MLSRSFTTIVILFWLGTMSWLIAVKVVPSLIVGDPPNYQSILQAEAKSNPVCWLIRFKDEPSGWAASKMIVRPDGVSEIHSRVFFSTLPLYRMVPGLIGKTIGGALQGSAPLDLDCYNRLDIDSLGKPLSFDSTLRLPNLINPVSMSGRIEEDMLSVDIHSGDGISQQTTIPFPHNSLLGNSLSPQALLPGLRVGQRWSEQIYSPLSSPDNPVEVLEATVERLEPIIWGNRDLEAFVVVYRVDPSRPPRSTLWVGPDGAVLKQETTLLNSTLQFIRMRGPHSTRLLGALGENWRAPIEPILARQLVFRPDEMAAVGRGLAAQGSVTPNGNAASSPSSKIEGQPRDRNRFFFPHHRFVPHENALHDDVEDSDNEADDEADSDADSGAPKERMTDEAYRRLPSGRKP